MATSPDQPRTKDIPGVIAPPPLIYLGGLAIGFLLEALLPGSSFPGRLGQVVGAVCLLPGLVLLAWSAQSFWRVGTPVPPYRETTSLVSGGPYRLTRNPHYVAFTLIYVAITLLADAPWALAPLPLVLVLIDRAVIMREERYLERRFGDQYLTLKRRTRRWV